jgi:uncharacterized glyoxalase superfamily protein PhnB
MNIDKHRGPLHVQDSSLAESRFGNVNLAGTVFDNVSLQRAAFTNINFSGVTFNDVNMTNVRITAANTRGMTINGVDVSALVHACDHPGRFNGIMPVLRVGNLQHAIDWYTGVIGFELLWRKADDCGGEACMLREGSLTLMLTTGANLGGKPAFTGTLYFNMKDVAAFYELIKATVDMVWPLEKMDYGTLEFGVRDPDGYVLAFAERP